MCSLCFNYYRIKYCLNKYRCRFRTEECENNICLSFVVEYMSFSYLWKSGAACQNILGGSTRAHTPYSVSPAVLLYTFTHAGPRSLTTQKLRTAANVAQRYWTKLWLIYMKTWKSCWSKNVNVQVLDPFFWLWFWLWVKYILMWFESSFCIKDQALPWLFEVGGGSSGSLPFKSKGTDTIHSSV